jgi:hypothetical protein
MVPIRNGRQSSIPLDSLMSRKGISVKFSWLTLADLAAAVLFCSKLNDFENPHINMMAFQALECPIFKTHRQASRIVSFAPSILTSRHQVNVGTYGWHIQF